MHFSFQGVRGSEMLKKDDKKSKGAQPASHELESGEQHEKVLSILHIPRKNDVSKACNTCGGLTYIILGIITIVLAITVFIVTAIGATYEHFYDTQHTGRMVGMIVLSVAAVIAIVMINYAMFGVCRKHSKPLHSTTVVLVILVLIQMLILGISVNFTEKQEMMLSKSISESFNRAREGDPKQIQLWDVTQAAMECCGLYSPEDYREPYTPPQFPPDIPASCCPSYNIENTTRDKEREMCKANRSFYKVGCKKHILLVVEKGSLSVISATSLLIMAEFLVAILGAFLSMKRKDEKHDHIDITMRAPKTEETHLPHLTTATK